LTVENVPFEHYIVDLSLREVTTSKGEVVTLCQIETNAPLAYEGKELGSFYSWGRVIEAGKPFEIECGPFCLILVKDCCGDMGVFTVSHTLPEEPCFHMLVYEGDKLVSAKVSSTSIDLKADFRFGWFVHSQRLRIETIPNIETYWEASRALDHREKDSQEGEENTDA
jgi:hypothetical protein